MLSIRDRGILNHNMVICLLVTKVENVTRFLIYIRIGSFQVLCGFGGDYFENDEKK
jgi:hypothetical protein